MDGAQDRGREAEARGRAAEGKRLAGWIPAGPREQAAENRAVGMLN